MSKGIDSLAAGLTAGETLLEAARPAVRLGGFAVQSTGTRLSYPTISDVLPETAPNGVSTTTGATP
jgi:sugar/nucleoside kinase (ribokinase family)